MPMPRLAKPNAMSRIAGSASSAVHDRLRPSTCITSRNVVPYAAPRSSASEISPSATSSGPEARREHALVELAEVHLEEDVPGRVVDGAVHRRDGEQRRGDVGGVRHDVAVRVGDAVDVAAEADAEREQVEDRLEHAGEHDDPVRAAGREQTAPHHRARVAAVEAAHAAAAARGRGCRVDAHLFNRFATLRTHSCQPITASASEVDHVDDREPDRLGRPVRRTGGRARCRARAARASRSTAGRSAAA